MKRHARVSKLALREEPLRALGQVELGQAVSGSLVTVAWTDTGSPAHRLTGSPAPSVRICLTTPVQ